MNEPVYPIARKHRLRAMLFCGAMLYFFANVQRVAIPGSVFSLLQEELNVSAPYITALGSAFMYVYAANQLFIGLLADRYGGGRVIMTGALLFCTGSLLFPFTHSLVLLYLCRALTGLGASALYLSLIKETIRIFNREYGIAVSVIIMIGYAGGIAANAPFVAGVEELGLKNMLVLTGILSVVFYGLYLLLGSTLRLPPVQKIPISFRKFGTVLKSRHNCELFLFSGVNFGLYYVIQTVIGKKFLEDFCRMNSGSAAWILSLMGTISAFSGVMFAVLSRMTGNRRRIFCRLAGWICLGVFLSITLLILLDFRSPAVAVLLCLFSLTASMSSITIPLLRETNPENDAGASISFMNFSFYLSVAVFGNLAGFLMDLFPAQRIDGILVYGRNSYLALFGVLTLFAVPVFYGAMRMRETRGQKDIRPDG